jgi:N6-adenosine-specific RNA methylase IME4
MSERYRTVVADPPWPANIGGTWTARVDKARPQNRYSTMSVEDVAALPVPSAEQAHLYLWITAQRVDWGYTVAEAWGFAPIILWTWRKPGLGVGRFRCNSEHILVARKGPRHGNPFGNGGRHSQATEGTVFDWPRGKHSEKPAAMFDLVESLSPAPRLELFARRLRIGWDSWGNEVGDPLGIGFDPSAWMEAP